MDWWAIKERQDGEDIDSDEDTNKEKEEGEGRQAAKKPKGTGQDIEQGQDKKVSKSGGGRVGEEHLLKSGGVRENGGMEEDGGASQRREDMRMYDLICEMLRGTGGAGVAGVDLGRTMPRALEANIREALAVLEEENKFMVDGPNVGLDGVTVHEIEADERVTQGREVCQAKGMLHSP